MNQQAKPTKDTSVGDVGAPTEPVTAPPTDASASKEPPPAPSVGAAPQHVSSHVNANPKAEDSEADTKVKVVDSEASKSTHAESTAAAVGKDAPTEKNESSSGAPDKKDQASSSMMASQTTAPTPHMQPAATATRQGIIQPSTQPADAPASSRSPGTTAPSTAREPMEIDETPAKAMDTSPNVAVDNVSKPGDDVEMTEANPQGITRPGEGSAPNKLVESSDPTATAVPHEKESTAKISKPLAPVRKRKPPTEDLTLKEVFEINSTQKRRPKKRKIKNSIKVSLSTTTGATSVDVVPPVSPSPADHPQLYTSSDRLIDQVNDVWGGMDPQDQLDNALAFFEETHEEQDPAYLEFVRQKKMNGIKKEMEELGNRDKEGQREIEDLIARLSREKRESTDKSHHLYREKVNEDERKEYAILQKRFQDRSKTEHDKIQRGLKYLQSRQQEEVNRSLHHHRQKGPMPENESQMLWQKTMVGLQTKHQRQIQEFQKKSETLRKKTSDEYGIEKQKIATKYGKKRAEVDTRRDKFVSQQSDQFMQLKHRYLRRHLHKFVAEREALKEKMTDCKPEGNDKEQRIESGHGSKSTHEKTEHKPPPPIRSVPDWARDTRNENAESVKRHKHRKTILSQAVRHVSIEIHNEGIWTLFVHKADDEGKREIVEKEFIQWGPRAFSTLESIVCGEVPTTYHKLELSESSASQGGQLRCSITDLRTSPEVAQAQRAEAYKLQDELQLGKLDMVSREHAKMALEAEKAFKKAEAEEIQASSALEKAAEQAERSKLELQKFTTKFSSFLGPDGNPLPTTNEKHRQELAQTILKYRTNITAATNKASRAHQLVTERKNRTQRLNLAFKASQKHAATALEALKHKKAKLLEPLPSQASSHQESVLDQSMDPVDFMVAEVVASFSAVADKRRESLDKKKSGSFSKIWAESFPELSESMKKSLWHRMVRRKQQAILRPSHESLINNLREKVKKSAMVQPWDDLKVEAELQKAEQIFLLACFPSPERLLPSVPTQNGQWAEPGSTVDLSVPESRVPSILPCAPCLPVLRKALSDFASAPGRQAAAVLNSSSFRPMTAPLTFLSKATSLAEEETVLFTSAPKVDGDPLDIPSSALKKGYTFSLKTAQARAQALRRKQIRLTEDTAESLAALATPKSSENLVDSSGERPPQKRKRTSKDPDASPRKKKAESAATKNSGSTTAASSKPASTQSSRSRKKSTAKQSTAPKQPSQAIAKSSQSEQRPPQASDPQQNQQQQLQQPGQRGQAVRQSLQQQRSSSNLQMQRQNQGHQSHPSNLPQHQTHQSSQSQPNQSNFQMQQHQSRQAHPSNQQQQQQQHQQHQQHQQQMAQFRMMHSGMGPGRQMPPGFPQNMQQMQQMQQFYAHQSAMSGHPGQGQRGPPHFPSPGISPMQMQRGGMSMPFPGMGMPGKSPSQPPHVSPASGVGGGAHMSGGPPHGLPPTPHGMSSQQQQQQQQQSQQQQQQFSQGQSQTPRDSSTDQNDPLFMLK